MTDRRTVLVVGAGAIGRVLGAGLTSAGHAVTLFDVDEGLIRALNVDGVRVERQGERQQVPVTAVSTLTGYKAPDVALFCVKSYATAAAAEAVGRCADEQTSAVSLQNGWGNGEVLAARFNPANVVIGVTYNSATVSGAEVRHTAVGTTVIGPFVDGEEARAAAVAELLESGGFEARVEARVREEIWKKLILNAATLPTSALTGLTAGALGAHTEMASLVDDVTREAVAVARSLGYQIDLEERSAAIHGSLERAGAGKASMLQDVEAGRRTEVDVVTGAVIKAAEEVNVDVPLHRGLYALVRGLEQARGLT